MILLTINCNILVFFFMTYFCDQNLKMIYLGELPFAILLLHFVDNMQKLVI